jgi:hypothetical protein
LALAQAFVAGRALTGFFTSPIAEGPAVMRHGILASLSLYWQLISRKLRQLQRTRRIFKLAQSNLKQQIGQAHCSEMSKGS